jgi:hypothetical protein
MSDALESADALRRAVQRFVEGDGAASPPAALGLGRSFVQLLDALIADLMRGSHFQFGAASVWLLYESDAAAAADVADDDVAGVPAVRLSHFSGASMHREVGYDERFVAALRELRAAMPAAFALPTAE